MNSRFAVMDLRSGETVAYTLVYPEEASLERGKLCVLSPMGMALLGARVGDIVHWNGGNGPGSAEVLRLLYQPEAAGDHHLQCQSGAGRISESSPGARATCSAGACCTVVPSRARCATGAIVWSGLGRMVLGLSTAKLNEMLGTTAEHPHWASRAVASSRWEGRYRDHRPLFQAEAMEAHAGRLDLNR
jgi:hypothetical protein